jgi:hypothetical protein
LAQPLHVSEKPDMFAGYRTFAAASVAANTVIRISCCKDAGGQGEKLCVR